MTITLEEYRRREAAGEITRPLSWGPVRGHLGLLGPRVADERREGTGQVPALPAGGSE